MWPRTGPWGACQKHWYGPSCCSWFPRPLFPIDTDLRGDVAADMRFPLSVAEDGVVLETPPSLEMVGLPRMTPLVSNMELDVMFIQHARASWKNGQPKKSRSRP